MIGKVERTIGEQHTSINQEIELSQKGIVVERLKGGLKTIIIPTMIEDPRLINITGMTAIAARTLTSGWYSDLVLYHASNSNVSAILNKGTNAASNASNATDILVLRSRELYTSIAVASSAQIASNSLVTASSSLFRKLEQFGTNQARYLVVTTRASAASGTLKFAFEVRGY